MPAPPTDTCRSRHAVGSTRALPSYSPELNPPERVFEEIRARVEGVVYESLDAKQAEAERYLKELQDDPQRVKQLCGWAWLAEALTRLPPPDTA